MRKLLFLFILILSVRGIYAQSTVQLVQSQTLSPGKQGLRVIKPVFAQDGTTLSADSAHFNNAANAFDAFGNVVITQSDGTVVYANQLNYNGNTKLALLTGNVRLVDKDATLTTNYLTYNLGTKIGTYIGGGQVNNPPTVITSKAGYYFGTTSDAYFKNNVVVNTPDVLIKTDTLKYNSISKIAYFYGPTDILSKSDKTNLYTENGRYDTQYDQAWFGRKNLYTDGGKSLKGDSLFYDGKAGFGKAIRNVTFVDNEQKSTLKGNVGIYRKADESALITGNAYVTMLAEQDSAKVDTIWMAADTLFTKLTLLRDVMPLDGEKIKSDTEIVEDADVVIEGQPNTGGTLIVEQPEETTKPLAAPATIQDSTVVKPEKSPPRRRLFGLLKPKKDDKKEKDKVLKTPAQPAAADSALAIASRDSVAAKDSLSAQAALKSILDTARTRIILAYHKVRIFKSDLQSKSDSAFYSYADSTIRCFQNPIIWTQGSQLSADTIFLQLKDRKLDNMQLKKDGFIVSTEKDSVKFNQVKGKTMTGLFNNSKLYRMLVDGNAESIYYTMEDSVYSGLNRTLSSRMRLDFANNKLTDVILVRKAEGDYYPIEKVPKEKEVLEGFIWKPKDRPASKEEIIRSLSNQNKPAVKPAKAVAPSKKAVSASKKN
ncbi:OstA-like protein [Pedobacter sp. P351]|uniref:OstA-like protein n=1 Tax=Pedobacter superstes TaxID=3133441 RepID=UPI0030B5EF55